MPAGLLVAGLAPTVGGLIGNLASSGDKSNANAMSQAALQNILNVNTPSVSELQLALQQYQNAGNINPAMTQVVNAGPSALNSITTDPRLADAQMQALQSLQQQGQGGLRPQDIAALAQARNSANQNAQAGSAALMQNMQARGIGGSGAELAAALSNSQNAANQANASSLQTGANATQNALNSIMNAGNLGNNMQQSNFNQQATVANANDVINRYNAMNQQQVGSQNTSVANAAQAQNLANQQAIMNQNTSNANYQQQYNSNLYQQDYQNQLNKASAASGQYNNMANVYNNNAAQTQSMYGGIGQALGTAGGSYAQYGQNQQFLDTLAGKKSTNGATSATTTPAGMPTPQDWASVMKTGKAF